MDDEFAAHEQLAHSEYGSVLRGLDAGTLDTSRVIRMPSRNSGETTDRVSCRLPISAIGRIKNECGTNQIFDSVNAFLQHSIVLGLRWAAQHREINPLSDPYIAEMMLNDVINRHDKIGKTIERCEWELRGSRGAMRESVLDILRAQRDAAMADEDVEMAARANRILERAMEL